MTYSFLTVHKKKHLAMPGTLMRQIFAQALPSQQLFEAREPRFPYKLIKKQRAMRQKNHVNY